MFYRQKEEELRNSLDPKYAHLSDELHVEISALASPAEAHARIAYALAEVKKYLVPDTNDMIWQTQMRDIERGGECQDIIILQKFYGVYIWNFDGRDWQCIFRGLQQTLWINYGPINGQN